MGSHDEEICSALTRMALAGDGAVLGFGLAFMAIRTWVRFSSHSRDLRKIEETPEFRIHDLRTLILTESHGISDSQATVNHHYVHDRRGKLVIVRGSVSSTVALDSQGRRKDDDVLTAPKSGEKGVILETTQTCLYNEWRGVFGWSSDWRGLLGWGSVKEEVISSIRKVPFVLVEERGPHNLDFAHIQMDDSSKHSLPLVTVYQHLHPVQASPYTFLQAIFCGVYPVGLLDVERILPPGKEITAVGILDIAADGQPAIKSSDQLPIFLTSCTREQLITEMTTSTKVLFWTGVLFSTLAIGVLGYASFKNWQKYKVWRLERERRRQAARQNLVIAEQNEEDTTDAPDGELCVVCRLRRRRAAFIPCGHRVCCMGCAHRVEQDVNCRCPVCRQNVNGTIQIYDP